MQPKFNINRPPVSDEEIDKHRNFDALVEQFKKQSLKKARGDESWWKNKKIQYTTVILGVTVVCTVTYQSLKTIQKNPTVKHEKITTQPASKTSPQAKKAYVAPQLKKLNKKSSTYTVNNQKGARITHPGSTRIEVPKGAFVNENGAEIIGDVTLEYREFDHLPDIMAAGIPMRHDSLGKPYQLESAGMFEIKAKKGEAPVKIKNGSPILVDLASYSKDDRFYQYYLDTVNRNWRYLGTDKPATARPAPVPVNTEMQEDQNVVAAARQADSLTAVYSAKLGRLPSPKRPAAPARHKEGRPTFVLESDQKEFPELAAFKNVIFEVGPENRNYSPELHEITWSDIHITEGPVKGKNYLLHLSHRNHKEKLVVYPVLKAEDYESAREQYEKQLTAYQKSLAEKDAKEKELKAEMERKRTDLANAQRARMQEERALRARISAARAEDNQQMSATVKARRLFQVAAFGIYNSDHPHPVANAPAIQPVFEDAASKQKLIPEAVYMIDHRRKTVVTGDPANPILPVSKNPDYSMCIVLAGQVYTCDRTTFRSTIEAGKATFPVVLREGAAENMSDFRKALEL